MTENPALARVLEAAARVITAWQAGFELGADIGKCNDEMISSLNELESALDDLADTTSEGHGP